ncbi:MAG: Lrp/AsnC family transcriptional regulator [Thermoplasmatales archaeon]|nr:MAG: Lrp/AsnC family transcriptional regulator [Thermoplasmatales archaeon]
MPKSSRKQIEADEMKILAELQKNSDESVNKIAKKCDFSKQKVWRVIKRLERNKIIWGYSAVVDNEKLNQKSYILLIKRSSKPIGDFMDKVIEDSKEDYMKKLGVNICHNYYLHGHFDWMLFFSAKDIKAAKKFSESINIRYSGFINEMYMVENIFPLKSSGLVNPEINKFKEFF